MRLSGRLFAVQHRAERLDTGVGYRPDDVLLFGCASDGLPDEILVSDSVTESVRIPIAEGGRSLNLANAAAIAVYEAWRQNGFADT